jgi:putative ABC transport system permease protein
MIFKNLFRRKGRTILTLLGIAIGVAAIVALGAMAEGARAGYTAMARGSQADLVLTQAGMMDVTVGGVEEAVASQLFAWPEVAGVDGMLMGNVQAEDAPYFYIFGYDPQGFAIEHFKIVAGQGLGEVRGVRGKPLILGRRAAQSMDKGVGDALRVTGGAFRIVGIYETGDGFEEGGAVIPLEEAQMLLLQPRRVSVFYIRLRDSSDEARLRARVERHFDNLILSTTSEFADRQQLLEIWEGLAWAISALAVIIGGAGGGAGCCVSSWASRCSSPSWGGWRASAWGWRLSSCCAVPSASWACWECNSPLNSSSAPSSRWPCWGWWVGPTLPGGPAVCCRWRRCSTRAAAGRMFPASCLV